MGHNILRFPDLHSTNSYAVENLSSLPDKQVIIADIQTAGRGQFDRKWFSDVRGNVYLSIVLRDLPLLNLTPYMAEVICGVLKEYGVMPQIKEPNDVIVDGKKIAGILSQSSTRGDKLNGIVIGAGINLNLSEQYLEKIDQPAISLNLLLGRHVDRDIFIGKLLDKFFSGYDSGLFK